MSSMLKEESKDTRNRQTKTDRQYNDHKKRTMIDRKHVTQKTKY